MRQFRIFVSEEGGMSDYSWSLEQLLDAARNTMELGSVNRDELKNYAETCQVCAEFRTGNAIVMRVRDHD